LGISIFSKRQADEPPAWAVYRKTVFCMTGQYVPQRFSRGDEDVNVGYSQRFSRMECT
jgi:hypothetical protein